MLSSRSSADGFGVTLAVLAALGFSFKAIFVKLAYAAAPVDAVTLLALRMLIALPVFVWVGWRQGQSAPPLTRGDWLRLAGLGCIGYYAASILDFIGLHYISAGLERLILFTYPTLTVLIGVLFSGKTLARREVSSLALSYAGIGLAFAHDLRLAVDSAAVLVGASCVFASSLAYAIYLSGSATMIVRLGSSRFSALALLVSTAATLLHFFAAQPLSAFAQPLPIYVYGGAMALFSTILPVFMLSAAIRRIGASRSALIGTLGPVLTILLGWWLLGEPLSLAQIGGAALVLAGVWLAARR